VHGTHFSSQLPTLALEAFIWRDLLKEIQVVVFSWKYFGNTAREISVITTANSRTLSTVSVTQCI
jgi:hypothetical protein